jgi:hypothetical protein
MPSLLVHSKSSASWNSAEYRFAQRVGLFVQKPVPQPCAPSRIGAANGLHDSVVVLHVPARRGEGTLARRALSAILRATLGWVFFASETLNRGFKNPFSLVPLASGCLAACFDGRRRRQVRRGTGGYSSAMPRYLRNTGQPASAVKASADTCRNLSAVDR